MAEKKSKMAEKNCQSGGKKFLKHGHYDIDNTNILDDGTPVVKKSEASFAYLQDWYTNQGWKFMSWSHCQGLGQQASWLMIGYTRVNNQSEARSAS